MQISLKSTMQAFCTAHQSIQYTSREIRHLVSVLLYCRVPETDDRIARVYYSVVTGIVT